MYSSFSNKQASKPERMSEVAKKRKVLSVEEKGNVIKQIESGKKKVDVCREFDLVNSTIETIWKKQA
jgi:transposase-like protein